MHYEEVAFGVLAHHCQRIDMNHKRELVESGRTMWTENDLKGYRSWKNLPDHDLQLVERLLTWFRRHGRDFRWRQTTDPYLILCAEVMLQRTRAKIVEPYFEDFRNRFSGPEDFVEAGRGEAEKLFDAIGLRWRARYFWDMQKRLSERSGQTVPRDFESLMALPGVGQYAASAVCVFAYGESRTVIDSNVLRILGRYYGVKFPDHARRSARVRQWASVLAPSDPERCREWNWALIDFGSAVCVPGDPLCQECPVRSTCWYASSRE